MNRAGVVAACVLWCAVAAACSGHAEDASGTDGHDHGTRSGTPTAGAAAPARHTGPQGRVGQFVVECGYSHTAPDDPIVHPGRPGRSHDHDFFGNTSTDASSTFTSLLEGDTTCQNRADTASYWAPTLLDGGEPVVPTSSVAYYRAAPGVDPSQVRTYPDGLKIVAGDMTATTPQPVDLAGWACGASSRHHATPPDCPPTATLNAVITFPDCWDGERVDSEDHRSHMANSSDGECPASHPVHVPQLTFRITYPISGTEHELTLSSGSTHGLHSDFFNAWEPEALAQRVRVCLNRDAVCGIVSNRSSAPLFRES